jgi:hypothetical protein
MSRKIDRWIDQLEESLETKRLQKKAALESQLQEVIEQLTDDELDALIETESELVWTAEQSALVNKFMELGGFEACEKLDEIYTPEEVQVMDKILQDGGNPYD